MADLQISFTASNESSVADCAELLVGLIAQVERMKEVSERTAFFAKTQKDSARAAGEITMANAVANFLKNVQVKAAV